MSELRVSAVGILAETIIGSRSGPKKSGTRQFRHGVWTHSLCHDPQKFPNICLLPKQHLPSLPFLLQVRILGCLRLLSAFDPWHKDAYSWEQHLSWRSTFLKGHFTLARCKLFYNYSHRMSAVLTSKLLEWSPSGNFLGKCLKRSFLYITAWCQYICQWSAKAWEKRIFPELQNKHLAKCCFGGLRSIKTPLK